MKPKKILIDYARKTGRMDRINQLLSLAYLLHSQAFLLYDEADTLMRECGLCVGRTKALSSQLSTLYDKYLSDFSGMIIDKDEKRKYFADLDELGHKLHEWAKVPEKWEPKKLEETATQ